MRHSGAIVFLVSLLLGCAAATSVDSQSLEIKVEQLPASEFDVRKGDAVSTAYQMTVRNRGSEAVTLRKIEMQAVARSPYTLRDEPQTVELTVEPGQESAVTFFMWSYPRPGRATGAEMVFVTGNTWFESAGKGTFKQPFAQSFREPAQAK